MNSRGSRHRGVWQATLVVVGIGEVVVLGRTQTPAMWGAELRGADRGHGSRGESTRKTDAWRGESTSRTDGGLRPVKRWHVAFVPRRAGSLDVRPS